MPPLKNYCHARDRFDRSVTSLVLPFQLRQIALTDTKQFQEQYTCAVLLYCYNIRLTKKHMLNLS